MVTAAALYELSRHPKWRERVRSELETVLGGGPYPSMDDIPRLPLLWGAIKEDAATVPCPAMGIFRQTVGPLELDGERIPTGNQVDHPPRPALTAVRTTGT